MSQGDVPFRTEPFTCELIAKRHSLSCHYRWTITNTSHTSQHPTMLPKVGCCSIITLVWPISIGVPNFTKVSSFTTDMWPKIEIQDGGRRHLEFCQKWDAGLQLPLYGKYLLVYQIWRKYLHLWPRYGQRSKFKSVQKLLRYTSLCISKMAAVRHLEFVLPRFWTVLDVPLDGLKCLC